MTCIVSWSRRRSTPRTSPRAATFRRATRLSRLVRLSEERSGTMASMPPLMASFLSYYGRSQSDMTDWLVVLPEDNWEICAREGLLGLGGDAANRLKRMAEG